MEDPAAWPASRADLISWQSLGAAARRAAAGPAAGLHARRASGRGRLDRLRPATTIRRAPLCIFVYRFLTVPFTGFKAVCYCRVPLAEFDYSMS